MLLGCLWAAVNLRRLLADKTFAAVLLGAALPAAMTFGVIPRECLVRLPFIGIIGHLGDTFSCVLIIHLLIIATFGLRSMWDRPVKKYAGTDMLIAAIFLALLAAIFFAHAHILHGADRTSAQHGSAAKMSVFFCAYATALFAALLALPWIVRGIRLRPTAGHLVAGGLCLFLLHFRHGLWTETKFDSYVANPRIRTDLAAFSPTISLLRESFESTGQPARVAGIGGVLAPGFNAVLGLEHFTGADALTNMWQWDLLEKSSIPLTADRRSFLTRASFPRTRTFGDLWNIRWYLGDPAELPHEVNGIEAVKALDLDIYASHRAWPRAFFTDRLPECSSLENFIDLLTSADGRPFAAIVPAKPSDAKPAQPESLTGRAVVAAHDYRLTENSTAFTIEAPTPGVTVLGNSFEPGNWRVTLDGHPVKCFRVNHAFLGVAIPDAGVHTLRFSYWPHTLTPALKIALGGLLLALSAVCLGIQNNSSRSPLLHREGSPH